MHYANNYQEQNQEQRQMENNNQQQKQKPLTVANDSVTIYQQQLLQQQQQQLSPPSTPAPITASNILMGSTDMDDIDVQQLLQQQRESYRLNSTNASTANNYGSIDGTGTTPYHDQKQQQRLYTGTGSPASIIGGGTPWIAQQQQAQTSTQLSQTDGTMMMINNQTNGHHHQQYEQQQYMNSKEEQQLNLQHDEFLEDALNDGSDSSFCVGCCCCCACCQIREMWNYLIHAENLHRAFCFGAIDGMLTGSGIAAASSGLGIFDPYGPLSSRLAIIGLAIASCTSDGLCMGIGHVWSTYVMHFTQNRERKRSQWTFQNHRGLAKARLVDMLLMRGVLKIDAMSLVDTLEGYPELFLSSMVGDDNGGCGPLGMLHTSMSRGSSLGSGGPYNDQQQQHAQHEDNSPNYDSISYNQPQQGQQQQEQQRTYNHMESYDSVLMNYTDLDNEDGGNGSSFFSLSECQAEGFVMMFAFCLFSVVPSLVFAFVPIYINPNGALFPSSTINYTSHGSDNIHSNSVDSGTSAASVTLTITSLIMILLGTWKSRFFSSSWVVFGIETVIVLILCIVSAFLLGSALRYSIGIDTIKVQTF